MSTTATRELLVIANEQGQHVCVAADRYHCLSRRYTTPEFEVSIDMARCVNGCKCDCHTEKNGAEIAVEVWEHTYGGEL